jgi:hypothetical protein
VLLNAHFEDVPFVLPAAGAGQEWIRVIDTIESHPPELRVTGGTKYPLQGRTLALFILDGYRRQRRASDHPDLVDEHAALQVVA